ncbi:MAG: hypothetical protein JJU19_01135 [Pararhodobacter sp.]|nr:hypothetical protein [Pararhodobacter sp.]
MNTPEWLVPGLAGAALGGAIVAVAGFAALGWMTVGQADRMAQGMATERVMATMIPICVERSFADPERMAHLATIRQASGTARRDALMATGWATMPGRTGPDRTLAAACLTALDLPSS